MIASIVVVESLVEPYQWCHLYHHHYCELTCSALELHGAWWLISSSPSLSILPFLVFLLLKATI